MSFDNEDVGKLQAQTLIDCLDAQGVENPKIIMMNGGTDVDNNAVLFQKGAHSVLDPLVDEGKADDRPRRPPSRAGLVENAAPDVHTRRSPRPAARSTACSPPTTTSPTRSSVC